MKTFLLACVVLASVAAAPNATEMQKISYLQGSWNCTWTAGTVSGVTISTFTPVMGGAWLQETEQVRARSGAYVTTTMHYTGYDPQTKEWMHVGPNSDGTFEVAHSADTTQWDDMIHDDQPGIFTKVSESEFTLNEKFTQDGQQLTYAEQCKKAS